jgi:hypothetical protein
MPTIIDALIVTLGLDPSDFKRGTKEAEQVGDQAQKKRDTVNKKNDKEQRERARQLKLEEQERKKQIDVTTGAIKNLGATLAGAVLGFEGIKGGIDYLANLNTGQAALGRTASRLGIDPVVLDTWGKAVQLAGGKAEDATQTIADLVKQFQELKVKGGAPGPLLTLLQQFNVPFRDAKGNLLGIDSIFKGLSARLAGMDEQTRSATLARAGVTQGLIDLFNETQTKQKQELADALANVIATRAATAAAEDLKRQWDGVQQSVAKVGQKILTAVTPATKDALSAIQKATGGDIAGANRSAGDALLDVGEVYAKLGEKIYGGIYNLNKQAGGALIDAVSDLVSSKPGARSTRNNNPGNIKAVGDQSRDAQGFRIFATMADGLAAMRALVSKRIAEGNDTISKLITRYEGSDSVNRPKETAAYIAKVEKLTGKDRNAKLTKGDLDNLLAAMIRDEAGLPAGARTPSGATPSLPSRSPSSGAAAPTAGNTTNVQVDQITVNSSAADPAQVAAATAAALQRKVTMAQANAGQS